MLYMGTLYLALNPVKCIAVGTANLEIDKVNSFQFKINVIWFLKLFHKKD